MNRHLAALAVAAVAALTLTGCMGKLSEPGKDAEVGTRNTGPADTLTFPDGFSNVAAKCDGPNRVYVIFKKDAKYGSVAVVANDPRCKK